MQSAFDRSRQSNSLITGKIQGNLADSALFEACLIRLSPRRETSCKPLMYCIRTGNYFTSTANLVLTTGIITECQKNDRSSTPHARYFCQAYDDLFRANSPGFRPPSKFG